MFVPLQEILKDSNFELVTTEVFGPVQASALTQDWPYPHAWNVSTSVYSLSSLSGAALLVHVASKLS